MTNEVTSHSVPPVAPALDSTLHVARSILADGLSIESTRVPTDAAQGVLTVQGTLKRPSAELFPEWLAAFKARGYTPLLRPDTQAASGASEIASGGLLGGQPGQPVLVHLMRGVPPAYRGRPWLNALLFLLTLASTLFVGSQFSPNNMARTPYELFSPSNLLTGWPFAATLLGILAAHEFGHYFAARFHKVAVTLPFFIPMPLGFGTLGAFIQLKEPISDRRKLFDIGVAGPLAGLALAVPLLPLGLLRAGTAVPTQQEGSFIVGNSLFYYGMKLAVFGRLLPDPITGETIALNQVVFAAWIGLLVTALNLLPVGQLDGGHTVFALFGRGARIINIATLTLMGLFAVAGLGAVQAIVPQLEAVGYAGWFVWIGLIFFLIGPFHPPALDDVTPLDRRRRWVGYAMIAIFVLTFVPVPFRQF